jgi:uncharacterized repeat protein (TIGR01451 family)
VICPDLDITKVADDETVDAGEPIGFTITVSNAGPGTATDVTLEDDLSDLDDDGQPDGLVWTEDSEACSIADQVLTCDFGDLAAGEDASVRLSAETSEELCATYTNVAVASASNNPDVDDSDATTVLCPGLNVAKTADSPFVDAGEPIGFAIEVSNTGPGNALGVTLDDPLPGGEGVDWAIAGTEGVDAGCAIDDEDVLSCGPVDLGADEGFTVMVESPTEFASCAVYDNTAVADADNSAPLESSASVTVECPDLEIEKTADAEQVDAGDGIGFLITLTNNGPGAATDVVITDELPTGPGIEWTGSATGEGCAIAGDTLTCEIDELAAGQTFVAHVSSPTTEEDGAVYDNVAEAGAGNHGTVEAEASTEVVCPPPPTTAPPTTVPPKKPPLPMTGGYLGLLALLGLLLVAGGGVGVLMARRRRGDALG